MFTNPDWTYIINFISIFLGAASIVFAFKNPFKRELHLIFFSNVTRHDPIPDQSDTVRQIHSMEFIFQNISKDILLREYIVNGILVDLSKATKIVNAKIQTNCKYNNISASISNNVISFAFDFLEPSRFIKFYIDYVHDQKVEAEVSGKIIGAEELKYTIETDNRWHSFDIGRKSANATIQVFPITSIISFWLGSQLFIRMFNLTLSKTWTEILKFNKNSFLILVIALIWALISIAIGWNIKKYFAPFYDRAEKEKDWYTKFECNYS